MTIAAPGRYAQWKAPSADGEVLLWPGADLLLRQTGETLQRLGRETHVTIGGVPLAEARLAARRWVGHADAAIPLVGTGHQTELYHPGVWIKNAVIGQIAHRLGGDAIHFAVDTDSPKHLEIRWPGGAIPITDDEHAGRAQWSGVLVPPTPVHLDLVRREWENAAKHWSFQSCMPTFLTAMRQHLMDEQSLSMTMAIAMHEVDWDLGLRHQVLVASPLWQCEPYLLLVHHILAKGDAFAQVYNQALQDYRTVHRLRSAARPMPDLVMEDQQCEMPFWLDDLTHASRRRAQVVRRHDGWAIVAAGEEFFCDSSAKGWEGARQLGQFLRRTHHRLSPRALTLTLYLRMLVVDQFVHGIGGGRYDQVTDQVMERFFGLTAPPFSVATATLYSPGAGQRQPLCVPCLHHRGHQLRHALLGQRKQDYVREIAELPRKSRKRQELYLQMHRELTDAAAGDPRYQQWQDELLQSQVRLREEQVLFDREWFYPLQPAERLRRLMDRSQELLG